LHFIALHISLGLSQTAEAHFQITIFLFLFPHQISFLIHSFSQLWHCIFA